MGSTTFRLHAKSDFEIANTRACLVHLKYARATNVIPIQRQEKNKNSFVAGNSTVMTTSEFTSWTSPDS
jgi:hypothetical protein